MPGTVYDHCDGLWSDEPGRAMLLLTADCLPIAIHFQRQENCMSVVFVTGCSYGFGEAIALGFAARGGA